MTPSILIRPVAVLVAAIGLNACGMVDSDPHRFENLANSVAAIDLEGKPAAAPQTHSAAEAGMRPALRVEVMDPHALWDARDGLDNAVERAAPRLVAAARNRQRLEERMEKLARRVGFRIGPGLRDRVIYRELFPFGLTVADLSNEVRPVAVSLAHVAARQEMRNLMLALGLDGSALDAPLDAAA